MVIRAARSLGALSLLAVGAVHLQQYLDRYSAIPTVGTLFLLNAIGCAVTAIGLLAPIQRVVPSRSADIASGSIAAMAVAIAAGSLIALFISETGTLFGFSESGYRAAIIVAIVAEATTIALLAPVSAIHLRRAFSRKRVTFPSANRLPLHKAR
jgi:hypothetical protein